MKAIVQEGYGSADAVKLREIDKPVADDDGIIVRVCAASVNAMDAHMAHVSPAFGALMRLRGRNRIRGADMAGYVESVGRNVTRFKTGDAVFGAGRGSFAEYARTTEEYLAHLPKGLSVQAAACLPVAGLTALQSLRDKANVQPGQHVLVYGAGGGVGTLSVQIAKALGARVTAVTGPRNLEVVRALGPDHLIDYSREAFTQGAARFDVVLDIAAMCPVRDCLRVLLPHGTLVLIGAPKIGGIPAVLGRLLAALAWRAIAKQKIVNILARVRSADLAYLGELAATGKLRPVIERECAMGDVPEALEFVESGHASAKVVINVGGVSE